MNENINLTKILKYCPKGTKLYSTIFGEVKFIECDNLYQIVVAKEDKYYYFASKGTFIFERIPYNRGECCLFPNKEQRDWSKFTAPWLKKEKFDPKTLKPFDKVLIRPTKDFCWNISLFSYISPYPIRTSISTICGQCDFCIPFNEDTKHLLGTNYDAPEFYRYWED